jgi:hypothetical protein
MPRSTSSLAWRRILPSPCLPRHRTQARVRRKNLHITNGNQSTKSIRLWQGHYYWTSIYMAKQTNWHQAILMCSKDTTTDVSTTKMCLYAYIYTHNGVTYYGTELVLRNTITWLFWKWRTADTINGSEPSLPTWNTNNTDK